MARKYAAVMALLAIVVVLLRGVKNGAGFEGTILTGMAWMALLGGIGWIVGAIAEATVVESVRAKMEAELAAVGETQAETKNGT